MNNQEISYALAKQLSRAHTLSTSYGDIELDAAMAAAVDKALRPILEAQYLRTCPDQSSVFEA
jgi:hypothetical protein